ncbi:hypothetical protein GCM10018777_55680 [Streptomyces albogriseolus]|uniref:hypothetical protein n=1 Tax=Streptomyces TaxID=1883 RepID=UPI001675C958|nr:MULTISPECIES: hypothetical protein [Streptomyces]GHB15278.1 hypothetical protein GCM10010330_80900 [Streptomyces tendae]GHG32647.1 hypothetical protein GCM10018777_55680 [Streptomyces viridodiastaticus]
MTATITPPRASYPRPQLVHDHRALFVEPVYEGGLVYAEPADDEDPDDDGE